ncbi:MAG: LTA synthase family protein [Elusimicrobia bacterium]|nr:LTA synthase family protein [Elusimicrobiota bacterium]
MPKAVKIDFDKFFNLLVKLLLLNAFLMALMSLYRLIFLLAFGNFAELAGMWNFVLRAFGMGLRFDASPLAYVNMPVVVGFLVLTLLSKNFNTGLKIAKYYYTLMFAFFTFATIVNFGFYLNFQNHINILIFGFFEDDTYALIQTIIRDRRLIPVMLAFFAVCYGVYKVCAAILKDTKNNFSLARGYVFNAVATVLILGLLFLAARGTVSMFPLGSFHADISPSKFINKLALNVTQPLTDTVYARLEMVRGTVNLAGILGAYHIQPDVSMFKGHVPFNPYTAENPPNVVVIVMESFGLFPILFDSPEFNVMGDLSRHFQEDILLKNMLPAGHITIDALEALVLNMPPIPPMGYITQTPRAFYSYASSAANVFRRAGFSTVAVYGGSFAWRGMNTFLRSQGFQRLVGEGDIVNVHRHQWGLNDQQFLELVYRELTNAEEPVFIFSLSTAVHPPYEIPPTFTPLPITIPQEVRNMMPHERRWGNRIFETFQFANIQLAAFLDRIKNSHLAENTIVVITGDHSLREFTHFSNEDAFLRWAVPFYIYLPPRFRREIDTSQVASHLDIMPTLYHLALSDINYIAAGRNLFSEGPGFTFNTFGIAAQDDIAIRFNFTHRNFSSWLFDNTTGRLSATDTTPAHLELLERYQRTLLSARKLLHPTAKERKTQKGQKHEKETY